MSRKYLWPVLIIAGIAILAIAFPHAVGWVLGIYPVPNGTPPTYQLWSGIIPALAIIGVVWPFVNCHVEGCPRYGRYYVEGFKVCHVHHPSDEVRKGGISFDHVLRLHRHPKE